MHDQVSRTEREDRGAQAALLSLVLSHHPAILSAEELQRLFSGDADAFDVALWALTGAGLLRQEGASVLPSKAALAFDRLPL